MLERFGWTDRVAREFAPFAVEGLLPGRVTAEHRGAWIVFTAHGERSCDITGRMRFEASGRAGLPATGDWVAVNLVDDDRGQIREILPRTSKLSRKVAGARTEEQVLAANVDTVFLVAGLDGDLNVRRLERYLAMAYQGGAQPVVVLTKADLCEDSLDGVVRVRAMAPSLPVHVTSAVSGEGLETLRGWLDGNQTVALMGSSGVGKSTLTNALAGSDLQATAETREDGRGRHTTTHRELVPLPDGGLLLDTPGIRELALWDAGGLEAQFGDVDELAERCRFRDCSHEREPGCAIRAALADGSLDGERYESYRKLQRETAFLERRQDKQAAANTKRRWKNINKAHRQRSKLLGRD